MEHPEYVILAVAAVLVLFFLSAKIVPQATEFVLERLGKYHNILAYKTSATWPDSQDWSLFFQ